MIERKAKKEAAIGLDPGPVIILVEPQLGANIGAAARAMLNCGVTDLRIVNPRDGWPNPQAVASAVGADALLDNAQLYPDLKSAVADCHHVWATTARPRGELKAVMTPRRAAPLMRERIAAGERVALLFGKERTGLEAQDVSLADIVITAPLNPAFASLNLAQAVLLVCYEWLMATDETPPYELPLGRTDYATRGELIGFFEHLEAELDEANYFATITDKRDGMVRNLRNAFYRGPLLSQDVKTLRGVVKALALGRPKERRRPRGQTAVDLKRQPPKQG